MQSRVALPLVSEGRLRQSARALVCRHGPPPPRRGSVSAGPRTRAVSRLRPAGGWWPFPLPPWAHHCDHHHDHHDHLLDLLPLHFAITTIFPPSLAIGIPVPSLTQPHSQTTATSRATASPEYLLGTTRAPALHTGTHVRRKQDLAFTRSGTAPHHTAHTRHTFASIAHITQTYKQFPSHSESNTPSPPELSTLIGLALFVSRPSFTFHHKQVNQLHPRSLSPYKHYYARIYTSSQPQHLPKTTAY